MHLLTIEMSQVIAGNGKCHRQLLATVSVNWPGSYSRLQKSCNKQAEQWKTTIDLLCLNQEEGCAEAEKIIRFILSKSIVVFHCSACLLQDFCNLL